MKRLLVIASLVCLFTNLGTASSKRLYVMSQAALVTGYTLDAYSSWGQYEANPWLRGADGRLGAKGLSIGIVACVGTLVVERLVLRRNPEARRVFTIVNFGVGGFRSGVAARNWYCRRNWYRRK